MQRGQVFSTKSLESVAWFDQKSSSWRTYQTSLTETEANGCKLYLQPLPKSGMMRNGKLYERQTLEPCTAGQESGLWPTPRAANISENAETAKKRMEKLKKEGRQTGGIRNLASEVKMWPTPDCSDRRSMKSKQQGLSNAVKMWRTPDNMGGGSISEESLKKMASGDFKRASGSLKQLRLQDQVRDKRLWPTPSSSMMTSADMEQAKYSGNDPNRPSYEEAKKRWATPTTNDSKNNNAPSQKDRNALNVQTGGSLNPDFVSWLMGYPKNWTDLEKETETFYGWPEEELGVPRVATGIKQRVNRLKALGNAVVPQCVELVGRMILKSGLLE